MKTILVPMDGSTSSFRALQAALAMAKHQANPATIHILNVQPPLITNNAARFFSADTLKEYYDAEGKVALAQALELMKDEKIDHQVHIEVGNITDIVNAYVTNHAIDHIVMGTRGLSAIPGLLLGSVTTKILHSVSIPVTLIK